MAQVRGVRDWERGRTGHRTRGPLAGTALVLPGMGYSADMPVLFYASSALVQAHWRVVVVDWDTADLDLPDDLDAARDFVEGALEQGWDHVGGSGPDLFIGKSLGTLAVADALSSGVRRVIALTPLLGGAFATDYPVDDAGAVLAVGGTADPYWDGRRARRLGWEVLEVEGASHDLAIRGNWRASLGVVGEVTRAVENVARGVATRA